MSALFCSERSLLKRCLAFTNQTRLCSNKSHTEYRKYDGYLDPKPFVQNQLCSNHFDTRRWSRYHPEDGDVIIATPAKAGTTWTQQIVGNLIFNGDVEFHDIHMNSPWVAAKFTPESDFENIRRFSNKVFLKSHEPLESCPFYPNVKYICVVRDYRDIIWSLYNHHNKLTETALSMMNSPTDYEFDPLTSVAELDASYGRKFTEKDLWDLFLTKPDLAENPDGWQYWSQLWITGSWWNVKHLENVKFVHYNNLKDDLSGGIRDIAQFIDVKIDETNFDTIVNKCTFESMKNADLGPIFDMAWHGGGKTFINKGQVGRWKSVLTADDDNNYRKLAKRYMNDDAIHYMETGEFC